jgi:hypothetical protein
MRPHLISQYGGLYHIAGKSIAVLIKTSNDFTNKYPGKNDPDNIKRPADG